MGPSILCTSSFFLVCPGLQGSRAPFIHLFRSREKKMNDAQTQILGPVILMDTTRRHIFVSYSIFDTLAYDQDPTFVSGQHQDVSVLTPNTSWLGNWAVKGKKRKADSSFVLSAIRTHC